MVPAGDAEAVLVQRTGVVGAADEATDLAHAREMAGEEAADHAGADDADPLDHGASLRDEHGC